MRFKVYLLRYRGRRRPWREVINGEAFVGDLCTYYVHAREGRFLVAGLISDNKIQGELATLYEPVLEGFAPLAFRLRGFERIGSSEGDFACAQEWHCQLP